MVYCFTVINIQTEIYTEAICGIQKTQEHGKILNCYFWLD